MTRGATLPAGAVRLSDTRLAVLVGVAVQPHPGIRSVAMYAGVPVGTARYQLSVLQRLGLVSWSPYRSGTLRPHFRIVPVPARAGVPSGV